MKDKPGRVKTDRYSTEADLAEAARKATKGKTQEQIAAEYDVPQSVVSQALAYVDNPKNRTRGHALRRRILRRASGLTIAGPYWKPLNPGDTPPGYWPDGEDPYPHTPESDKPGG